MRTAPIIIKMGAAARPTIAEQIGILSETISALRTSFKDAKGRIKEPHIRREIKCLKETIAQLTAAAWIPVADEMPDSDTTVLIYGPEDPSEPVWLGYHNGEAWCSIDNLTLSHPVTHWRHLPEPPKGEQL